jgi:hypothetical protein
MANSPSSLCELRPFKCCTARDTDRLGGIDSNMWTWSRLIDPACTTISCARAVSRNSEPQHRAKHRVTVLCYHTKWYLQSQIVWPPRLYASIHPNYTGSAAIQPPKGAGFPDPLSGTLNPARNERVFFREAIGRAVWEAMLEDPRMARTLGNLVIPTGNSRDFFAKFRAGARTRNAGVGSAMVGSASLLEPWACGRW